MSFSEKVTRRLNYKPRSGKLAHQALFVSFGGRQVSDSPLEIFNELQKTQPKLKKVWGVISENQVVPAGATKVVVGTPEWFKALSRSKYLVSNNNLPQYFRKRPGQIYLQTWHGTPLKRIGKDIGTNKLTEGYNNAMKREAGYWDYLVSPNQFSSEIFPRAFGFRGRLLETGYPRNDRLVAAKSEKLREKFGIAPSQTVVLYAPTWRDDARDEQGNWATVNNLQQVKLPSNFTLLYRGHTNTAASERKLGVDTIDVTDYPDVTDLYLLADVLVTDYSSVMFDFSVTGKPMLFLCPDLSQYQALRGFYFDFEGEAPGPILKTAAEVVAVLKNLDKSKAKYAQKYKNWRKKFNRLEDGKASARVVDAVFHA
jgi:CDP-glycerol glycerophosphotransferase